MTTTNPKQSRRQSSDIKKAHIAAWKESGLSKRKYCEQQDLKISTFAGWFRQTTEKPEQPKLHFVPVPLKSPKLNTTPIAHTLQVAFDNGVKVTLSDIKDIKGCLQMLRVL